MNSQRYKTKARFGFCHQLLLEGQREENMISGQFFSLSNFYFFGNFEMGFITVLTCRFMSSYQYFWSHTTFLLKFWYAIKQV